MNCGLGLEVPRSLCLTNGLSLIDNESDTRLLIRSNGHGSAFGDCTSVSKVALRLSVINCVSNSRYTSDHETQKNLGSRKRLWNDVLGNRLDRGTWFSRR